MPKIRVPLAITDENTLRQFLLEITNQLNSVLEAVLLDTTSGQQIAVSLAGQVKINITNIATNTTDLQDAKQQLDSNVADIADLLAGQNQLAIMNLAQPVTTVSAAYVQTEVQQLAGDVQALQTGINNILNRLRLAKIIV